MKLLYTLIFSFLLAITAFAQDDIAVTIDEEDFSTCNGSLNDTNPVGNYGPNEDETITICADGIETVVNLYWISFDLGEGDVLEIFDGTTTAAPLIGTYTGQDLALLDIYSTNVEGCLTLHWTSDATDEGEFGCIVNCGIPCSKPVTEIIAVGESEAPILACPDEVFTFDASGTTFFNGANFQSVLWDFGDGTTNNTDWPTTTHSYPNSGIYKVNVYVTDDAVCQSLNVVNLKIYVSTDPILSAMADDYEVCVGQAVDLTGTAEGVTFEVIPNVDFGGAVYIPDNQGCFSDTIFITGFPSDQQIESIGDIESLFVNFEHTFMSDFTISYFCPDGSGIIVHNQGGGGYWLGEPIDIEDPNSPGVGWDYWWSPDVTSPTWADAVFLPGYLDGNNSLLSGTYAAVGDWNALVGCPLNGPWIIEVCDIVGIDDGFIFDWAIILDPAIYPDDLTFTPSFDPGCEDTYWSGEFITDNGGNCDNVVMVPGAEGNYTYTYTSVNNHGCEYVQTIEIEVYAGPIPTAGSDLAWCNEELQLTSEVTNPQTGFNYGYTWQPSGPLNNANQQNPTITELTEETEFIVTVYPTNDPACAVSDTVFVSIPVAPEDFGPDTLEYCVGVNLALGAPQQDMEVDYDWTLISDADPEDPEDVGSGAQVFPDESGVYIVTMTEQECGYQATKSYDVTFIVCDIIIPNIFTPNSNSLDTLNNSFFVQGLQYFPFSPIQIYNRWGNLVYESEDYKNNWSPDESEAAEGTYFYVLGVNKFTGMEYFSGHLTLLRKK